jgi:hypothetical protein
MSGKSITQQQVKLYMSYRTKQSQVQTTAKAGIFQRSARRIEKDERQTNKGPLQYSTRKDLLNGLYEKHLIPLLKENSALRPITLLDVLNDKAPEQFDKSHLRTLQRHVKRWRVKEGPEQEVIFFNVIHQGIWVYQTILG